MGDQVVPLLYLKEISFEGKKWFCLELYAILKVGGEVFLDLVYGENDELFLEKRDCLFMEFCAISRMGLRIFLSFAAGFEDVFFGFDMFGFVRVQLQQRSKWRRKWLRVLLRKEEEEGVPVVLLDLVLLVAFALSLLFLVLGERHFLGFGGSGLLPVSVPS